MNIDGEMIGINVAVRAGAQNIAFAIPVDKVMEVTAELLSIERLDNNWHGVVARPISADASHMVIDRVEENSPAEKGGLRPGDRITAVGTQKIRRLLDIERSLLGLTDGTEAEVSVERDQKMMTLSIVMAPVPARRLSVSDRAWALLGLRLKPIPEEQFQSVNDHYHGGLTVTEVRRGSPADRQRIGRGNDLVGRIRRGDVLVGLHIWETTSMNDVSWVLKQPDLTPNDSLKVWILRGQKTFYGHLTVTSHSSR